VPFTSLIYHDGSYRAFVYKDGKAHLKQISIGDRNDSFVEVLSGIEEGDNLIVLGQNKLTDQIEIVPTSQNPEAQNENN
jgi:hypothetical protein